MNYTSGIGRRFTINVGQTHSPDDSTFLSDMMPWPLVEITKSNLKSLRQSMHIYFKNKSCQISSRSDLKQWRLRLFTARC